MSGVLRAAWRDMHRRSCAFKLFASPVPHSSRTSSSFIFIIADGRPSPATTPLCKPSAPPLRPRPPPARRRRAAGGLAGGGAVGPGGGYSEAGDAEGVLDLRHALQHQVRVRRPAHRRQLPHHHVLPPPEPRLRPAPARPVGRAMRARAHAGARGRRGRGAGREARAP
jgi:hypothetical protein